MKREENDLDDSFIENLGSVQVIQWDQVNIHNKVYAFCLFWQFNFSSQLFMSAEENEINKLRQQIDAQEAAH